MGVGDVRLKYPGLVLERRTRGRDRWRVRVESEPNRKITLAVGPDAPDFHEHYLAARAGERIAPAAKVKADPGTMGWLADIYLIHLQRQVAAGTASPLTLKERRNLAEYVLTQRSEQPKSRGRPYRSLPTNIPEVELIAFQHRMADKPGKARNVWKFLRAMYDHGVRLGHCRSNPARAVPAPEYRGGGGAVPWTVEDLEKFRKAHPKGSMAHLALSLFMFTACRIGDAVWLGREQEVRRPVGTWLEWQPRKRGSAFVSLPLLAPLDAAIRSQTVIGPVYLMTEAGKPFASPEALRNRMKKWCASAGLENRSSHGIRKAAGHLMALHGATQYEIMAVHGHANASTSEIYTKTVERMRLGEMAVSRLAGMDW